MARRLIDISSPLRAGIASEPPHMLPQIDYVDHHQSAPGIAQFFGISVDQLPDGEYAAVERVNISTHNGTHMDAPYHFFSSMNHALKPGGEPSWRIDEVPLEWCFQPAVKLDFRHMEAGYVATPGDVEAELKRIGHTLKPLEIVLVNTAPAPATGMTTTSIPAAASARQPLCGCLNRASASSVPMAGAGMRRFPTPGAKWRKPAMPA